MNNEKTLPKAWKKIDETSEIAVASSGVSKVLYIQDIGEKTEGNGYIDKITGKLYLCKTTNEDVEVTDNFVLATTLSNASRLDDLFTIKANRVSTPKDGLELCLYKINKLVIVAGSFMAKANYSYTGVVPYGYRPRVEQSMAWQDVNATDINTATIKIRTDGSIYTSYAYENKLCVGTWYWETNE